MTIIKHTNKLSYVESSLTKKSSAIRQCEKKKSLSFEAYNKGVDKMTKIIYTLLAKT